MDKHIVVFRYKAPQLFGIVVYKIRLPIYIILIITVVSIIKPLTKLQIPEQLYNEIVRISYIVAVTFLFIQIVNALENIINLKIYAKNIANLDSRRLATSMIFIKRIILVLIIVLAVSALLINYDRVRELGVGLLTSAAVISAVAIFAAQRAFAAIFAGFQVAFTQPIRINDQILIEGQFGRVEEITMSYVILRVWDKTVMVIPTNYFMEKPFRNFTRGSTDLLAIAYISLGYSADINLIREEYLKILNQCPYWNREVQALHVTQANNNNKFFLELRAIASANNADDAFELQCFIREKIISYVNNKHPEFLS